MIEQTELERFWRELAAAPQALLLLDYDGTLAPFRVERDQAVPYPGVRELLAGLRADGRTRLVLVSGRPISDLLPLLGLDPPPEVWGAHGNERLRPGGRIEAVELTDAWRRGLDQAAAWARAERLAARLEAKHGCLALHWRGLPADERRELADLTETAWSGLAATSGLGLHHFDGGLELRVPVRDKGDAVRALLAESPPSSRAAYLGDDRTDEDAFRALSDLAGERGLGVLVRAERRPTAARLWLRPPEELLDFLSAWRRARAAGAG